MNSRLARLVLAAAAAVIVLSVGTERAFAVSLSESRVGVYGTLNDEQGKPVVGVKVVLATTTVFKDPLVVTSTDKGFVFPRVSSEPIDYYLKLDSQEWFISSFRIKVRRQSKEIFQDDAGKLNPANQQMLPPIRYRGGNATLELVVAKIAEYKGPAPGTGHPAAPAPEGKPKELTLEQQVQELEAQRDFRGASDKLKAALAEKPDPELRWWRAKLLAQAGESSEAIKEGRKALLAKPEMKQARPLLADWLVEMGSNDEAVALLQKEREIDPTEPGVPRRLTSIFTAMDRKADAEAAAAKWMELAPNDLEAQIVVAGFKAGRGDFAGAEQLYNKVGEADPANAYLMFYNVGAAIWNRKGDVNAAVAALEKSIKSKPDFAKAYRMLANCKLNQGKLAEARQLLEKFLEVAPNDPEAADVKADLAVLPKK